MTIAEAITTAHQYRPNNKAQDSDIIRWINEVDSRIDTDIYRAYFSPRIYVPYTISTPTSTELLAERGFDRLYQYWICASIDELQGDSERYNEEITKFNSLFEEYSGFVARNRMAKHRPVRYY